MLAVLTDDRLDTCHATDSDFRGPTIFDYERALVAVGIELLGLRSSVRPP